MSDDKQSKPATKLLAWPLLVGALAAAAVPGAYGNSNMVEIFLRMPPLVGEAVDVKHRDEIVVTSFASGFANTGTVQLGGGGGAGRATCDPVVFTKRLDTSSPQLVEAAVQGWHFKDAVFTFRRIGGEQHELYKVTLTDLVVTRFSQATTGLVPTEEVTVDWRTMNLRYVPQLKDGRPGPEVATTVRCR